MQLHESTREIILAIKLAVAKDRLVGNVGDDQIIGEHFFVDRPISDRAEHVVEVDERVAFLPLSVI